MKKKEPVESDRMAHGYLVFMLISPEGGIAMTWMYFWRGFWGAQVGGRSHATNGVIIAHRKDQQLSDGSSTRNRKNLEQVVCQDALHLHLVSRNAVQPCQEDVKQRN